MDEFLAFQKAIDNWTVIMAVAFLTAGPAFGVIAMRGHATAVEVGSSRWASAMLGITWFGLCLVPAVMMGELLIHPKLALADHREQARYGLYAGFLALIVVGIGLALARWLGGRGRARELRDRSRTPLH